MAAARATLRGLGAVDADGRVTARGRAIAAVGAHPRLARALLDGAGVVGARRAAEVVALLSRTCRAPATTWSPRCARVRRDGPASRRAGGPRRRRLRSALPPGPGRAGGAGGCPTTSPPGWSSALAYPERLARLRPGAVDAT